VRGETEREKKRERERERESETNISMLMILISRRGRSVALSEGMDSILLRTSMPPGGNETEGNGRGLAGGENDGKKERWEEDKV